MEQTSEQFPKLSAEIPNEQSSEKPHESSSQVPEQTATSGTSTMMDWMVSCIMRCSFGPSHSHNITAPGATYEEDRINKVMLHVFKTKMFCKFGILLSDAKSKSRNKCGQTIMELTS